MVCQVTARYSLLLTVMGVVCAMAVCSASRADSYDGKYCKGKGDAEFLRMIDRSFGCFHPNADLPNVSFVYNYNWDGLCEGLNWAYWWIQNSFGATYCSGPFIQQPWRTHVQNSMDFWFKHEGDGKSVKDYWGEIAPDGCLCDAASPETTFFRQGDAYVGVGQDGKQVEWGVGFTAAGVIMQADRLLISRDRKAIDHYLPKLERCCNFIESYRDPKNNLFLVKFAADLLAPSSVIGRRLPDGTLEAGYLAELSIDYAAALDRMVQLCKLVGDEAKAADYEKKRAITVQALPQIMAPEGYFVKSIDLGGVKHGLYGQAKYGYFVSSPNINAVCFRVVDDATSRKIYEKIASIPGLRPHAFVITNYPCLDDTLEYDRTDLSGISGAMTFGLWTNGGAWMTEEARAIMTYYRVGAYDDVRRSFAEWEKHAANFRLDDHLKNFGSELWYDWLYTSFCYDNLGVPAAVARGLLEYVYTADSLILYPHIPPSITRYEQKEPIHFGEKLLYISVENGGSQVKSVRVNGRLLAAQMADRVELRYDLMPKIAAIEIVTSGGDAVAEPAQASSGVDKAVEVRRFAQLPKDMLTPYQRLVAMRDKASGESVPEYASAFLDETIAAFDCWTERANRQYSEVYPDMAKRRRGAILGMYKSAALAMYTGFDNLMTRYASGSDEAERSLATTWVGLQR